MPAKAATRKLTKTAKKAAKAAETVAVDTTASVAAPAVAPAAVSTAPLLSLSDVASYLQVAERTVYLWAQQGKLPSFKLGNLWRFRKSDLDTWIEESRQATPRKKI